MLFTTSLFVGFFAVVFAVYWILRNQLARMYFLLAASYVFYAAWDWRFLALLTATIGVAWAAPKLAARFDRLGPVIAGSGIVLLLALLGVFKYYGFFVDSLLALFNPNYEKSGFLALDIILPVGISFYIFQAVSYIVDVRRKDVHDETSLLRVALYVSFFPQLVAGPIVRASDFMPQLETRREFDTYQFRAGLKLILIGFIYKAVFADHIAGVADPVFQDVSAYDNTSLQAATLAFYSQIYFDFAGYSTMAIGLARMLGFWLPRNFNYPYSSTNVSDFWRRWHISLSSWLRDYLYIPLGGNRKGSMRTDMNSMTTMLLGGLWHGASWNFVIWGALHGLALMVNRRFSQLVSQPAGKGVIAAAGLGLGLFTAWLITQVFVALCWVPFRAETFGDTLQVLNALVLNRDDAGLRSADIPWLLITLPVLVDTFVLSGRLGVIKSIAVPSWLVYCLFGVLAALMLASMQTEASPFIYFQF